MTLDPDQAYCTNRCYEDVSFREWCRWLVDNEVVWVLVAIALTWLGSWLCYKVLRKRWGE